MDYILSGNNINEMQALIESGIDIDQISKIKWTPLYFAVFISVLGFDNGLVNLLLQCGANVNFSDNGTTALMHSITHYQNYKNTAITLIDYNLTRCDFYNGGPIIN